MSRKKHKNSQNDEPSGPGWELVYSGFVLILLCFFIMICSFSSMEEVKVTRFVRSFSNAVNILTGGLSFTRNKVVLPPSADMVGEKSELADIFDEVEIFAGKSGLAGKISLELSTKGLNLRLPDTAVFNIGQAETADAALPLLRKIGSIISRTTYPVRIEGHTDNVPIHTARYPSNWELSTARAVNVLRFFLTHYKIDKTRLSAVGFGEYQPLAPNTTPEGRARNRRVEIIFVENAPVPVEAGAGD